MKRKEKDMRYSFRGALLCGAILLSGCGGAQNSAYTITYLGNPNEVVDFVRGIAINSSGKTVVLKSASGGGPDVLLTNSFIWSTGAVTDLPSLGGGFNAAAAINDQGMVVGIADTGLLFSGAKHPYQWQNGTITDLSTAGGTVSPTAVNNNGWIVGTTSDGLRHAVLLRNGQVTDLSTTLGADKSEAVGINDNGDVIGNIYLMAGEKEFSNAYLLKAGQVTPLLSLGGPESSAAAINRNGQVVGWANTSTSDGIGGYITHAVLWQNGGVADLGTLSGDGLSYAHGLNNQGHVVGDASIGGDKVGFLYRNGKMLNLNTQIPSNSGWKIEYAWGINDAGQIVGQGIFGGKTRAFLMTPR
jgi:probable HAF family extracellular repeat protein